jgi:hypothetical protein
MMGMMGMMGMMEACSAGRRTPRPNGTSDRGFTMRPALLLATLFCCLAGGSSAVADVVSDLRALRADIESAEEQVGKGPPPAADRRWTGVVCACLYDAMAQRHHRALLDVGGDECAIELAYAKKYGL